MNIYRVREENGVSAYRPCRGGKTIMTKLRLITAETIEIGKLLRFSVENQPSKARTAPTAIRTMRDYERISLFLYLKTPFENIFNAAMITKSAFALCSNTLLFSAEIIFEYFNIELRQYVTEHI